jgi:hypothetical protein
MRRGSCRNEWVDALDARLTSLLPVAGPQYLEITVDLFNVLNLIRSTWGVSRDVTSGPSVPLFQLMGWDVANGRGVYQFVAPPRDVVDETSSRWRLQLGLRYGF